MLSKFAFPALCAAALAVGGADAAVQNVPGAFTIELAGHVPVICRAQLTEALVVPSGGIASLGRMNGLCNNANGYVIYADHSPELANAVLVVDGIEMKLDAVGATRIARSDHAAIISRSVALKLPQGATGGSLSFRVVAL